MRKVFKRVAGKKEFITTFNEIYTCTSLTEFAIFVFLYIQPPQLMDL